MMANDYNHIPVGTTVIRNGITLTMTADGWRAELQHTMMRRCRNWDYCRPWIYLITIGCQQHPTAPMPHAIPSSLSLSSHSQSESSTPPHESSIPPHESSTPPREVLLPIPASWQMPLWLQSQYSRQGRPRLFGELSGTETSPTIALNPFGKSVEELILSIPQYFPQVRIIEHVVMPNHLHIIIRVIERLPEKKPLGFIIDRFKSWVNRRYKEICLGLPANTIMEPLPAVVAQRASSAQQGTAAMPSSSLTRKRIQPGLVFEGGFHDRILFRDGQLENMIAYCKDNPRRLWKVVHNSQYFHTLCGLKLSMPLLLAGGTAGRSRWQGPLDDLLAPVQYSHSRVLNSHSGVLNSHSGVLNSHSGSESTVTITFNAIGNRALLKAPERIQIQCSRSMSPEAIAQKRDEVLAACEHGVVPISPCISPGEKAIARAVMESGHNLIALFPQGIPDTTYKPYKAYFDACATGQLLLISPWKYEQGASHLKRWQCLFLNDISAQLTVA